MQYLFFLLAMVGYSVTASLPFTKLPKLYPSLYFGIGVGMAMILNFAWLTLARMSERSEVLTLSVVWDSIITLAFIFAPILFFGIEPGWKVWVGASLIMTGMIVAKC